MPGESSHAQILKSSALIGGASAIGLLIGVARTKAMAVLLTPAGYGLFALYWNVAELARIVAGMGLNNSGVRQIADALASGDGERLARTATTLRRMAVLLGLVGALLLAALSEPVSRLSFGDATHAGAIAALALAVLPGAVSYGRMALLQGLRRIAEVARSGVFGALLGTLASLPIVYFWREQGIVPALVATALATLAASWWFSRRIEVAPVAMSAGEVCREAGDLLKLGFAFMASALLTVGVTYAVQLILLHRIGDAAGPEAGRAAVGCYQAAWFVGGYFASFILQAMGTDFFPRLTAVARDDAECNRLVNEQAEVGLLLAGPGLLATLTLAPLLVVLLYSQQFEPAAEVLRWICLGMMLRVLAWPIGFIVVARNAQALFLGTEVAGGVLQVGLVWLGVGQFGLNGAGIGFFAAHAVYLAGVLGVVRSLSGFRWSAENLRIAALYGLVIAALFAASYFLSAPLLLAAGGAATLLAGIASLQKLCRLLPPDSLPRRARRLLSFLRLLPASGNV